MSWTQVTIPIQRPTYVIFLSAMNRSGGVGAEKKEERHRQSKLVPQKVGYKRLKGKERTKKQTTRGAGARERGRDRACPREVPASLPSLNAGSRLLSPAPSTAL